MRRVALWPPATGTSPTLLFGAVAGLAVAALLVWVAFPRLARCVMNVSVTLTPARTDDAPGRPDDPAVLAVTIRSRQLESPLYAAIVVVTLSALLRMVSDLTPVRWGMRTANAR